MCEPGYTQPGEERSLSITNFISFLPLHKQHAGSSWVHSRNAPFLCTSCPGKWSISPWFLARLKHRCVSVSPLFSSPVEYSPEKILASHLLSWPCSCSFRPLLSQSLKGSAFVCFCSCDHHNMWHEISEKSYLNCWTSESDLGLTELSPGIGKGEFRSGSARKNLYLAFSGF